MREPVKTIARISAILLFVVALFIVARRPAAEQAPDAVTLQLKWVHQAQFAGFYMAQERLLRQREYRGHVR